ncbi:TetR/AcrR family transcriptional regulator [Saccharothrix obliqua]|uniref:TetR/AcrR family transcriptional regulator n=1 Tax=Saccharothrix obliqua TaxID=2861747 RepID=UPI001C5D7393|nr:TetR/AcrR family transcriptional regulator [Saccharothrix obliqua]MBW4721531.1 TetR/AcrR family transcriptional regulator [Saccharothrix obliqua]
MADDPRKGPRRRGQVLEQAILRAALDELAEVGYHGLTIDRVAARAHTNKTAVYRRWPSRAALAVAAYLHVATDEELPDTGDLRTDVLALLRGAAQRIGSPQGGILHVLAAEMGNEPDLVRTIRDQVIDTGLTRWLTVLGRAVARGQARPEALSPRIATVAVDLLRHEYLVRGVTTITDNTVIEIVDAVYLPLVRA